MKSDFLQSSILISAGMFISRLLGIAFSLVLASFFAPENFGIVQYAIAIGTLLAISTQPFGQHVVARYISKYRQDTDNFAEISANVWIIWAIILLLTFLVAIPALFVAEKYNISIIVIFIGTTFFYTYWGLSLGYLSHSKLNIVYLGSNLVQLLSVIFLIYIFDYLTPTMAGIIYGSSYFLPIIFMQIFFPLPVKIRFELINKRKILEITKFSLPILTSHAFYKVNTVIAVLALEYFFSNAEVGVFGAARSISLAFLFIPSGIAALLMPKSVTLTVEESYILLKKMLCFSTSINFIFYVCFLFVGEWALKKLFGPQYIFDMSIYYVQSFAMIMLGIHTVATAVIVGTGDPRIETVSRFTSVATALIAAIVLIPVLDVLGATLTSCVGALSGLLVYFIYYLKIKGISI